MNIKQKILLSIFVVGLLVALPAGGLLYYFVKNIIYQNELNNRTNDLKKMVVMVADNLEIKDYIPIVNYLNKMKAQDGALSEIAVINNKNKIISHTNPEMIGSDYEKTNTKNKNVLSWQMDIKSTIKKNSLGFMNVNYDRSYIITSISIELQKVAKKIAIIALTALLIGIIPGLWFAFGISQPLQKLARECHKVSAGNLEIHLEPKGNDEVYIVTREVKSMVEKLKELDQMKDDFVNNVSHELRSPLASIKSYIEILQSGTFGALTAKQLESIEIIKKATVRLSTFVNNVLDVAKIKAGKFELGLQDADLCGIVSEVIQMYLPLLIEKGIQYKVNCKARKVNVKCDVESIKRVVTNLLSNALKFTPEHGKIEISVTDENDFVRCEVKDTGQGITEEDLPKLFHRFEQSYSQSIRRKGTGLGLSISKDIIEMHKGKIWAESEIGKGSKFIFIIPKTG